MTTEGTGLSVLLQHLTADLAPALQDGVVATSYRGVAPVVAASVLTRPLTLVVVASSRDAEELHEALGAWLENDDAVGLWPAWDVAPFERVSPDVAVMGRRAELRRRLAVEDPSLRVVLATARSLLQLVPPARTWRELHLGLELDRDEFVHWLADHGYRREPSIEHRGEFSVRGDVLDVWPAQRDEPIRIELFGDEVERLATFDVATQRSLTNWPTVTVYPAREWSPTPSQRERARALAEEHPSARDVFEQLAEGRIFDGMESWLSWCSDGATLRTLLPATAGVITVDAAGVATRADDLLSEEAELAKTVADTWGFAGEAPLLHRSLDEVLGELETSLEITTSHRDGVAWDATDAPVVQGQMARVAAHLARAPLKGAVIVATTTASRDRMAQLLADEGCTTSTSIDDLPHVDVTMLCAPLPHGLATSSYVIWSEADVTGRRAVRRQPRARARHTDGFFDDLAIGSYVVHRNLGVARYAGSTTRTLGETTRDYLILEFRGDDKLYLPTDQIDLITPYSGGESPTLSRMGGTEWQRTRAKARSAAQEVADELVELYRLRAGAPGHVFSPDTPWQQDMEALFPYTETPDQRQAIEDVKADMESPRPMDRLVCADVGFGKTEIAVRAIFKAVQDGKQAALLVPTTLLASQHFQTLTERYAGFPVRVALLSRFVSDEDASKTLRGLREGSVDVVVGTHRLLGDRVKFRDLGLLVVDEEQRFGVLHKDAIKRMSVGVDVLTLSASPIPRTLEMALTGIRDLSMVTTPPVDRRPILTHVGEYDEAAIVEAVRRELLREGQVFYVHNRVADIDVVAERLGRLVPEARIVVAHGQMDENTLESIVQDFWERRADVLVCTTIVESGIDMPTVNTLIVDRADRLGLGQLHQLRGRVGRGNARAYAYLFHPRDQILSETAYERLRCIGDNTALGSGFKIAMRDLEIRGAGNFLGERQSGHVAAVGYDLYVQLVAEAVAVAKGERPVTAAVVSLPRVGVAHLPDTYVTSEDQRLEAYRRLAGVTSVEGIADVEAEWRDRYGPLPSAAHGLLLVTELRVECLRTGIRDVVTQPNGDGTIVKFSPLVATAEERERWKARFGRGAYDEATLELRVELDSALTSPQELIDLLRSVKPESASVA